MFIVKCCRYNDTTVCSVADDRNDSVTRMHTGGVLGGRNAAPAASPPPSAAEVQPHVRRQGRETDLAGVGRGRRAR